MLKNSKFLFSLEQITFILSTIQQKQNRKAESQFGNLLRESRKIRSFYGKLSLKYLKKVIKESSCAASAASGCRPPKSSQRNETIFTILESRLDVVLYRSRFFESIETAKQWILRKGVYINKKKVSSPARVVLPGDVISLFKNSEASPTSLVDLKNSPSPTKLVKKLVERKQKSNTAFEKRLFARNLLSFSRSQDCSGKSTTISQNHALQPSNGTVTQSSFLLSEKANIWRFKASRFRVALYLSAFWDSQIKNLDVRRYLSKKRTTFLAFTNLFTNFVGDGVGMENRLKSSVENHCTAAFPIKESTLSFANKFDLHLGRWKKDINELKKKFLEIYFRNELKIFVSKKVEQTNFFENKTKSNRVGEIASSNSILVLQEKKRDSNALDNFIFSTYKLFLKKQWLLGAQISEQFKKRTLRKRRLVSAYTLEKKVETEIKQSFARSIVKERAKQKQRLQHQSFVPVSSLKEKAQAFRFKNFPVCPSKLLGSADEKKEACFSKQKSIFFFKGQESFVSKKIKPLHLEVSYRSASIVFLYPPQLIFFPSFINVSYL